MLFRIVHVTDGLFLYCSCDRWSFFVLFMCEMVFFVLFIREMVFFVLFTCEMVFFVLFICEMVFFVYPNRVQFKPATGDISGCREVCRQL